MLIRYIIGYTPSLIIPALMAFVAVFMYTRLLSPSEYGQYALAINTMNLLNTVFFFWLQTSLPRLMPEAVKKGEDAKYRTTAYITYAGVSAIILMIGVPIVCFVALGDFAEAAVIALPMALARSILNLNQAFHRSSLDFKRYNMIECGQAVAGLAIGLALVSFARMESLGANIGMILGMLCMLSVDIKTMIKFSWRDFDPAAFREIARYGAPLAASFTLCFVIGSSDRFLIDYYRGAAEVGVYSAGYTLVDRILTMLFMAISIPSFPLAVQRLEHEGSSGAQNQMFRNGRAVLFIVLPACAGLLLTNRHLAGVLIGGAFREDALKIIPWIVVASVLNGLSTHYFSHAFHLAKKPNLLFWIQLPVAATSLLLNFLFIPRFGYMGAAYTAFVASVMLLVLTISFGYRVFFFSFPFKEGFQISAAVAIMSLVLSFATFPVSILGLAEMIFVGCLVYGAAVLLFNVLSLRTKLMQRVIVLLR